MVSASTGLFAFLGRDEDSNILV